MSLRSMFLIPLALASMAAAAELRIAVVDSKAVFDGFKGTKDAQEKYDKQVAAWEQVVADKQKELATIKEQLEKQSLMLSDEKKRDKMATFQAKQADLQKLVQSLYGKDGQVVRENEKFTAPIVVKIRNTVQLVAKAEGYDMVLDKSAGAVFYHRDDQDLTPKVLDKLNSELGSTTPSTEPKAEAKLEAKPAAK